MKYWQGHRSQPLQLVSTRLLACWLGKHRSEDRAQEAREHTLAEQWIPRTRIGKGPGQPPQLACTRAAAGQGDSESRDRALEAQGTHARRAGCGSRGDALARA